jgi:hypothetical protein
MQKKQEKDLYEKPAKYDMTNDGISVNANAKTTWAIIVMSI